MNQQPELYIWTVYDHPLDYPDKWVARAHRISRGFTEVSDMIETADTLEEVRTLIRPGLYRLDRHPGDDVNIVESWV